MQLTPTLAQASRQERLYQSHIVNAEIRRLQANTRAAHTAQIERAKQIESSRNEWLARDLSARRAQAARRPGFFRRIANRVTTGYAVAYAMVVNWPDVGEGAGLWEILQPNEER